MLTLDRNLINLLETGETLLKDFRGQKNMTGLTYKVEILQRSQPDLALQKTSNNIFVSHPIQAKLENKYFICQANLPLQTII